MSMKSANLCRLVAQFILQEIVNRARGDGRLAVVPTSCHAVFATFAQMVLSRSDGGQSYKM